MKDLQKSQERDAEKEEERKNLFQASGGSKKLFLE